MPVADKDSVLTSTKKMLGIPAEYDAFDLDIIIHINSVLSTLYQLGVGLAYDQTEVEDADTVWTDILTVQKNLVMIKSYVWLRVRLLFDPPATGFATDSYERQIKELEWRITVAASSTPTHVIPIMEPIIYDLTGGIDFPDEAPIGAHGIDFESNQEFRKV